MSSPTKHRASNTNSGHTRNDESSHARKLSDTEHGMAATGRKSGGEGKKAPAPVAAKRGG
ncbi:hypothetical protein AAW51_5045 [Caldimonas brevitalea]|uniref:Uncharacterized protein n=1 Tax=Caldimonas brevitalea TaxID=413882 RepID=A0A0G3BWG0_9BURK|nr:hypothetical protein AAW51_5045 [Caldimonas brevitalea]